MIVVVAGIVRRDGRILLGQRRPGDRLALKWEFPGGKLERGESPEQALARELREELDIAVEVGDIRGADALSNGARDILVLFYDARLAEGTPKRIQCHDLAWVLPEDILSYDLAPADEKMARKLFQPTFQT